MLSARAPPNATCVPKLALIARLGGGLDVEARARERRNVGVLALRLGSDSA
jgi:hypothetical protein